MPSVKSKILSKILGSEVPKKTTKRTTTVVKTTPTKTTIVSKTRGRKKPSGQLVMPKFLKMKYSWENELQTRNVVNTMGNAYIFNLNSLGNPYIAQATSDPRPYGFDQIALQYTDYKVHGAYVKVEFAPLTTTAQGKVVQLVIMAKNSKQSTNLSAGDPVTKFNSRPNVWTYPLGDKKFVFKKYFSVAQLEGISKSQFKNNIDSYTGEYNPHQNPVNSPYFEMAVINQTDATVIPVEFEIDIEYLVENMYWKKLPNSVFPA